MLREVEVQKLEAGNGTGGERMVENGGRGRF